MPRPNHGRTLSPRARYLLVLALVLAFATAAGAAGTILAATGKTPLARHAAGATGPEGAIRPADACPAPALACVPTGSADAATIYSLYGAHGVAPAVAPQCPSGLAVDLGVLRGAMGLP